MEQSSSQYGLLIPGPVTLNLRRKASDDCKRPSAKVVDRVNCGRSSLGFRHMMIRFESIRRSFFYCKNNISRRNSTYKGWYEPGSPHHYTKCSEVEYGQEDKGHELYVFPSAASFSAPVTGFRRITPPFFPWSAASFPRVICKGS